MADRSSPPAAPDRFLVGLVVAALALVVLGIAAVLVGPAGAPPAPPPGSPVAVTQQYVTALRAGEQDRAYELLARAAQNGVSRTEFNRRFSFAREGFGMGGEPRLLFELVREDAETAEVRVTVSRFNARSEPFSARTVTQTVGVPLVREDGAWRIAQAIGPYPFAN